MAVACATLFVSALSGAVLAEPTLTTALASGRLFADIRYRLERVADDAFNRDATANTMRARAGYESGRFQGFYGLAEAELTQQIGAARFDDTSNGRTEFPVIADPQTADLNQLFLNYDGIVDSEVRLGRQRLALDNERFIGAGAFRQNEQTFDAAVVTTRVLSDTQALYAFLTRVHGNAGDRSQGGDVDANAHVVNLAYDGLSLGRLTAYGYLLGLDDNEALSSQSYGVRFAGERRFRFNRDLGLSYALEFAEQRDYGANPADYSVSYYLVEPGFIANNWRLRFGLEVLEADDGRSFQTPLATLHAFNGAADKFLRTPLTGLRDYYAHLSVAAGGGALLQNVNVWTVFHHFRAEDGDAALGSEWSVAVNGRINDRWSASVAYTDYMADEFSTDTRKFWLTVQLVF